MACGLIPKPLDEPMALSILILLYVEFLEVWMRFVLHDSCECVSSAYFK